MVMTGEVAFIWAARAVIVVSLVVAMVTMAMVAAVVVAVIAAGY